MSDHSLYSNPALYNKVFPLEKQEVLFFQSLIPPGPLLDLGCGDGQLAHQLGGVGLDLEPDMLSSVKTPVIAGDILHLPVLDHSLTSLICRLFGISYAIGGQHQQAEQVLHLISSEFRRVRTHSSVVILEIPLAWNPHHLCGIEETADISPSVTYSFRYLDILQNTSYGAVLDSLITVQSVDGMNHQIHQPLHVFTPDGARKWMKEMRCSESYFYASYDLETKTDSPPKDCLRGVIVGD